MKLCILQSKTLLESLVKQAILWHRNCPEGNPSSECESSDLPGSNKTPDFLSVFCFVLCDDCDGSCTRSGGMKMLLSCSSVTLFEAFHEESSMYLLSSERILPASGSHASQCNTRSPLHVFTKVSGRAIRRRGRCKICNCGELLPTLELEGWRAELGPPVEAGTMWSCMVGSGTPELWPQSSAASEEAMPEAKTEGRSALAFSSPGPSISICASHPKADGKRSPPM